MIFGHPEGTTTAVCGLRINATAVPAEGASFTGWTGSITTGGASLGFSLDGDMQITANFARNESNPPDPADPCASGSEGTTNCTPIVVNLGDDPWDLTGLDDPVLFDIAGQGRMKITGWTARNAAIAFLALDRNGNGTIDSGAELFGNATPLRTGRFAMNGFLALAENDSNADGVISEIDLVWPTLLLWTDLNHNGLTEANELSPISESEVTEISLTAHRTARRDAHGNVFGYQGSAKLGHRVRPIYDISFVGANP